jgi:hypothetical protein
MKTKYAIYQWGQLLFEGSFKDCLAKAKDWTEKHGNVDLVIKQIK